MNEQTPQLNTRSDTRESLNAETDVIDPEHLRSENETLRNELRMRTAVYDIENQLIKAGARSPKLLSEQAKAAIQFGDDGAATNIAAIIEQMKQHYPEQFGMDAPAGSIDGGAGRKTAPSLTKDALSRMSPAEIQRLDWAEVRAALSNG